MTPRVSVVTPAFQAEWCVGAAVASVLWQTYRDFELVVVDDGSTDATAAIVEAHRGPITLIRKEHNEGLAAARNTGAAAARGELLTFCDADDILFARHLEALMAAYDRHGGIVAANSWWLFPGGIHPARRRHKGRFPRPAEQRRAILEQNFLTPMSIFPRKVWEEVGGFREELTAGVDDWDFWIRAIFAGYVAHLQHEPLSLFRWGASSLSARWRETDAEVLEVLRFADARLPLTDDERAYVRRRLSGPGPRELSREGDCALREGRYGEAARSYRRAAALQPSERALVWKARVLSLAPPLTGPLVRRRQLRIEERTGFDERHVR
jgi:glycosyltransferase involved in cell wall biosynthesis